jgi:hypothetical protein
MQITTIGLDIAKNVFQVHGIDPAEKVTRQKATSPRPDADRVRSLWRDDEFRRVRTA